MNVLVLGGTGSMGVPLVNMLAQNMCEVYVTTRRTRVSNTNNIHYIVGNAHQLDFVETVLKQSFDVIIDFMVYDTNEFRSRVELYLKKTKRYFFLSSSRVYANSEDRITEKSQRLLDVTTDQKYLNTDEYALAKAREEDILKNSSYSNWVIIRPYITYNNARLQLGVLEKELWLHRALSGKKIVFSRDMAKRRTTLTYGYNVASRIAKLVGSNTIDGETFHIVTDETITWNDVLDLYLDVFEKKRGKRPEIFWLEADVIGRIFRNEYQIKYDRLYDRMFDNTKIENMCGSDCEPYTLIQKGLDQCLCEYLDMDISKYQMPWRVEGNFDRLTGDRSRFRDIDGITNKIRYYLGLYLGI